MVFGKKTAISFKTNLFFKKFILFLNHIRNQKHNIMKTRKLTIEAQQICLEAAKEVLNYLEIAFADFENDNLFSEEPTLELRPYNAGYEIKIDTCRNYENEAAKSLPAYFSRIHIQPNTFFEDYMEEGKNAKLEYSNFFKQATGQLHNSVPIMTTSGSVGVFNMFQFAKHARNWVALIKREIESI